MFFGANDACLPGGHTGQHVPLEYFKQNLINIMKHSSVIAQKPRLILVTPPPVNEYQLEEWGLREGVTDTVRTAEYTKRYADATREIGDELGVVVLDIWSIFMKMTGWQDGEPLVGSKKVARSQVLDNLLVDGTFDVNLRCQQLTRNKGLHFLPAAYKAMFESMMDLIGREWPDQYPENAPYVFPRWTIAPKA